MPSAKQVNRTGDAFLSATPVMESSEVQVLLPSMEASFWMACLGPCLVNWKLPSFTCLQSSFSTLQLGLKQGQPMCLEGLGHWGMPLQRKADILGVQSDLAGILGQGQN